MTLEAFLTKVKTEPLTIEFCETMQIIEAYYRYTPTAFSNGDIKNAAGSNAGSCKIFAFARRHGLSEAQTLACFGDYYRKDVLENPAGSDHANIRRFIHTGWQGISFTGVALEKK